MERIRHIAISSDHPGKAADYYKSAFGWHELGRFGLDGDPDVAPRPSGVFLTDGALNIALLKFSRDQAGHGLAYEGIHHIGVHVPDLATARADIEALGTPCIAGLDEVPPGAHQEIKFRGAANVVFDIADIPWPGTRD